MKHGWGPALFAAILLIGGLEFFFRFASAGPAKVAAIVLMLGGIVVLGCSGWRGSQLASKVAVVFAFVVYLIDATTRFPGLIKDPLPGDSSEVATMVVKVVFALLVLTASAAVIGRGVRAAARSWLRGGGPTTRAAG
jgi:hypothetical protein